MVSLLNLAEQCHSILEKGHLQEYVQAVRNAYGTVVKKIWYEGKQEGVSEVNGSFIYSYKNLKPVFDEDLNMYFITIPSSYVELPHEIGINQVSYMNSQDKPFIRIPPNSWGLFAPLQSALLGGNQAYYVEGNNMYFPKLKEVDIRIKDDIRGLLLKLTVGFDTIEVDEQLNISPAIIDEIVSLVIAKYTNKVVEPTNKLT